MAQMKWVGCGDVKKKSYSAFSSFNIVMAMRETNVTSGNLYNITFYVAIQI